ncbi:MAG: hypothetical protein KAQ85_00315 [Thermodesulfovibrionia bacterium]|nr:hypothetical protein [Thermodesulfovibrionia bacterium]
MRKYPAKCPDCGEYMEPKIESDAYSHHSVVEGVWTCLKCNKTFEGIDDD